MVLALFGLFSAIIFQKQLGQQRQVEEMNLAQNMKGMQEAVRLFVNDNKERLVTGQSAGGITLAPGEAKALPDAALAEYLPQGFGASGFKIALKRGPAGARQPLQVVIISSDRIGKGAKLDEVSAARIAAMAGASAGVIKPTGDATGTLGLWKLDQPELTAMTFDPDDLTPVRIVAALDFALDEVEDPKWSKVLFRDRMDGFPHGNTMLTDLDMGGNDIKNAKNVEATESVKTPTIYNLTSIKYAAGADAVNINQSTGEVTFNKNLIAKANLTVTGKTTTGTLQAGATTLTGPLTGTTANFSGNVTGGLLTANATATPDGACSGGQVAKNGNSTMICNKGKWMSAEDAGGKKCMKCTYSGKNVGSSEGNRTERNFYKDYPNCASLINEFRSVYTNINPYVVNLFNSSTLVSAYNRYSGTISQCPSNFNSDSTWASTGAGGNFLLDDMFGGYDRYYLYIYYKAMSLP